jgi:hypothetical protein
MQHSHTRLKKHPRLQLADKLALWLSTSKDIDGLWVGTMESAPHPALRRVEDALRLIKQHNPLHYSRVLHHLERVWVNVAIAATACYEQSIGACVLDERFVLSDTTTLERIASTIIHEATHARLEHWGIRYEEDMRSRIEAICFRRELAFAMRLPDGALLEQEIASYLEFYEANGDFFSDANFEERRRLGGIEALRHLGAPAWLAPALLKVRSVILRVSQFVRQQRRGHPV